MKRAVTVLVLLFVMCTASWAEQKVSVAFSYGSFMPTSSKTRDEFGSSFSRIGLTTFDTSKPAEWRFIGEIGFYDLNGPQDLRMIPVTVGAEKRIGNNQSLMPYIAIKGGPYFGTVENNLTGDTGHHVGLNLNASLGIVLKQRFFAEARYDYFSPLAGATLDGFSLTVGVKLFDLNL